VEKAGFSVDPESTRNGELSVLAAQGTLAFYLEWQLFVKEGKLIEL
jgi:hypothetical protein